MTYDRYSSRVLRWTNRAFAPATLLAVLMLANIAAPQSPTDETLLSARERLRLNRQARESYDKAIEALDHVDVPNAVRLLDQAAQADPESIELQFLTARLAYQRGRVVHRDESVRYYGIAEKSLQRIAQRKDLPTLTKDRLKRETTMVAEEKKNLEVRDTRRSAVGEAFRKLYAAERYGLQLEGQATAGGEATDRGRVFRTGEGGIRGAPGQPSTGEAQPAGSEATRSSSGPSIRVTDLSSRGGGPMMGPPGGMAPMGPGGGMGGPGGGRRR